jgi:hypothetical protein
MPNFCTTIVIKLALRWHLLRLCIDDSAEPSCFGVKWEKDRCLDQKCSEMPRDKSR